MSINFATKNVKMPGALKAFIEKHLLDIEKIAGEIIDAEVIVNEEKLSFKVEISLKTRMHSFYAEDRNKILKQAVRNTLFNLKTQAKKIKGKIKEEKKRTGHKGFFRRTLELVSGERSETRIQPGAENILISENFSRKPITVEEAVFFLKESKENGFMFINAETSRMTGVFINTQGSISLIEPDI